MKHALWAGILLLMSMSSAYSGTLPKYSHVKLFGTGWECDRGFYPREEQCLPLVVPEHAHLDLAGNAWECESGYFRKAKACTPIQAPANAKIDPFGNAWNCNWGYYRDGEQCLRVVIPVHGILNGFGNGWECAREFKRTGNICMEMTAQEKVEQQKYFQQNALEEAHRKGPETAFCQTAYNKCTSSCSGTVYAHSSKKELKHSDFTDRCTVACAAGRQACVDSDSRCDVFRGACTRDCPDQVFDRDSVATLNKTNARRVCEDACQSGGLWCEDQQRRLSQKH